MLGDATCCLDDHGTDCFKFPVEVLHFRLQRLDEPPRRPKIASTSLGKGRQILTKSDRDIGCSGDPTLNEKETEGGEERGGEEQ